MRAPAASSGNDSAERWLQLERRFAARHYDGAPDHAATRHRVGTIPVLLTAPHAVNHHRNGIPKLADRRTGGLAELLHELTGATSLAAASRVPDWGRWADRDDDFTRLLRDDAERNRLIVDLHGMGDHHGIDVCIGTAGQRGIAIDTAVDALARAFAAFEIAVDVPFSGLSPHTVTQFARRLGVGAVVQIELSARLRDPEAHPETAIEVVSAAVSSWPQPSQASGT